MEGSGETPVSQQSLSNPHDFSVHDQPQSTQVPTQNVYSNSTINHMNTNYQQQSNAVHGSNVVNGSTEGMANTSSEQKTDDGIADSNKRTALAGQWRTPPTMLFFPGTSEQHQSNQQQLQNTYDQHQQQLHQQHGQNQHQQQQNQQHGQNQHQQQQNQQHGQNQHQQQQQQIHYQQAQPPQQLAMPPPQHVMPTSQHQNNIQLVQTSSLGTSHNANQHFMSSTSMAPAPSNSSISTMEGGSNGANIVYPGVPVSLVTSVPNSTEDYAKALQEAYRRGAEAAAMAAAAQVMRGESAALANINSSQNLSNLVSAVSCPDFQQRQNHLNQSQVMQPQQPMQTFHPQHHSVNPNTGIPPPVQQTTSFQYQPMPTTSLATNMPPPPPVPSAAGLEPVQYQPSPMFVQQGSHPGDPILQQQQQQKVTVQDRENPAISHQQQQQKQQQLYHQQRSVSLPDMSSYAAQQEEEKRQKRLARNRASARLRRLRKKNLVDAYEIEVGILEKTLQALKDHEWGGSADDGKKSEGGNTEGRASALIAALSMDRGQQLLTSEQRKVAASDILEQQLKYLEQLESLLQEQFILHELARIHINGPHEKKENDDTEIDNFEDLRDLLQLSDEQVREINDASANWEEEWHALQTVKASLLAMKDNDWLWNEGCVETCDQFLRILHKNQISKLLLWCDHNVEAIDELDCVNARPLGNATAASPIFSFGVDSHPGDFLDDEK